MPIQVRVVPLPVLTSRLFSTKRFSFQMIRSFCILPYLYKKPTINSVINYINPGFTECARKDLYSFLVKECGNITTTILCQHGSILCQTCSPRDVSRHNNQVTILLKGINSDVGINSGAWISRYISDFCWEGSTHPYPKLNGCLLKPLLNLWQGWVIIRTVSRECIHSSMANYEAGLANPTQ